MIAFCRWFPARVQNNLILLSLQNLIKILFLNSDPLSAYMFITAEQSRVYWVPLSNPLFSFWFFLSCCSLLLRFLFLHFPIGKNLWSSLSRFAFVAGKRVLQFLLVPIVEISEKQWFVDWLEVGSLPVPVFSSFPPTHPCCGRGHWIFSCTGTWTGRYLLFGFIFYLKKKKNF